MGLQFPADDSEAWNPGELNKVNLQPWKSKTDLSASPLDLVAMKCEEIEDYLKTFTSLPLNRTGAPLGSRALHTVDPLTPSGFCASEAIIQSK